MITKNDILEALGADTDDRFMTGMLVGIGVGAIVGSAVAMLLSPKAGPEMRQMISERGSDLLEKAKSRVGLSKNGGAATETSKTTSPSGTLGEMSRGGGSDPTMR